MLQQRAYVHYELERSKEPQWSVDLFPALRQFLTWHTPRLLDMQEEKSQM